MDLKDIVSIAGAGGLKTIVKQRPDGLIVAELDGSGKKFMSNRIHMFTPLENISIYTENDSESLANVFWKMKTICAENPPIPAKSRADELKAYMAVVLPDYDRDQVFISDIKKLIKWYNILDEYNLVTDPELAAKDAEGESDDSEGIKKSESSESSESSEDTEVSE
ncbi:MAG: hypothetical protein GY751_13060 [Bacteroidetes bacterium]|nr:hypothetical protein [Bacteroidota bacterium]